MLTSTGWVFCMAAIASNPWVCISLWHEAPKLQLLALPLLLLLAHQGTDLSCHRVCSC